jgi:hypothetical protein
MTYTPYYERTNLIVAYDNMIQERIKNDWQPYFVNFMFKRLPGNRSTKKEIMKQEVYRVYKKLVKHVVHHPKSPSWIPYLPFFVGCPDLPVAKWEKELVRNVVVNDGLHFNGCLLLPPKEKSRVKEHLEDHFYHRQQFYYLDDHQLDRIHATLIKDGTMMDYMLKHFKRGNVSADDILILPRVGSEF